MHILPWITRSLRLRLERLEVGCVALLARQLEEGTRLRVLRAHEQYLATPQRKWQAVFTVLLQRLQA